MRIARTGSSCSMARTWTAGRSRSPATSLATTSATRSGCRTGKLAVSYDKYRASTASSATSSIAARTRTTASPSSTGSSASRQGRPGVGAAEQRHHGARPAARDDAEGPGLSDFDRGAVARRQRHGRAADREPVHARDERRHQGRALHDPLPQLHVEDVSRRPVGARRSRGARRRADHALRQRRARAPITSSRRSAAATSSTSIRR